ncbi:MAG TPA: rhodanese-like domain-containing protein [Bacteriovoracaceae bacterium]|nr:rhodanese-like domain-containing protein [Bacteriovoracaceae bacterium]
MGILKQYWPLLLGITWFSYRWLRVKSYKKNLPELKKQGAVFIDVRTPGEFQMAHAKGSINIPLNELAHRLQEIPKEVPIVVACASGTRSGIARLILKRHGLRNVYNLGNWSNMETP